MSSVLLQLQDTVRQFKASYEFEQASAKRAIDWNKFWAMAYRQALHAQRGLRSSPQQFHSQLQQQQQQQQQPREQQSLRQPREAREQSAVEAVESGVETYATPLRQAQIDHRSESLARRTLTLSSRHSQPSPQTQQSPTRAPRPLQSPPTQQKRVQFAPPEDYQEQQIYRYEEAEADEDANGEAASEEEQEEQEEGEGNEEEVEEIEEVPFEQDGVPTDDIIYIDIELDDGSVATVGIAPEEDPQAVALEFVREHQLAEHYVDLLAKYLHQTLSETTNIQVYDDPPDRVPPPLVLSLESVVLSWSQKPSLASIRSRHVVIVRLQNNQNFDWNEIVGARQTEMLAYQDVLASGDRVGLGGGGGGTTVQFRLMTSNTSLVLPHGRKPIVHLELWQISRRDMPNVAASVSDPAGMLEALQSAGSLLAAATFVTNNDEYDGNGSAMLPDRTGRVLGTLSFGVRRALMGSQ